MVMCEYFSAASDEAAVVVLDAPGGPDPSVFDVLSLKDIDPVVVMARLEGILTDCTYDEARARPAPGNSSRTPRPRQPSSSASPTHSGTPWPRRPVSGWTWPQGRSPRSKN